MTRLETQVSKTDTTIKKIIEAVQFEVGGVPKKWTGRQVSVVQVDPSWTRQIYNDALEARVYIVGSLGSKTTVFHFPKPSYGAPATQVNAPDGEVVVVRQQGASGAITCARR